MDGALTNVTILLEVSPLAIAPNSPLATQSVALVPLHWIIAGGFRTNGVFKLCMAGETNRTYQVLASDDLSTTNWLPIGIMGSSNGIWRFLDDGATNRPLRFYRTVELQ